MTIHTPTILPSPNPFGHTSAPPGRDITIGVGIVIIDRRQFLASRRKSGCKFGVGCMALPGGHIERNEKLFNCVVREALEETGLIVVPIEIDDMTYAMYTEEWFGEGRHHFTIYVAANRVGGTLTDTEPEKHHPWQWYTIEDMEDEGDLREGFDWIPLKALKHFRSKIGL